MTMFLEKPDVFSITIQDHGITHTRFIVGFTVEDVLKGVEKQFGNTGITKQRRPRRTNAEIAQAEIEMAMDAAPKKRGRPKKAQTETTIPTKELATA